jgi:hypothetical protein
VPDEDDRRRDASSGADAGWSDNAETDISWVETPAPDDISSLARDIAAYHRELRKRRRNTAVGRYVGRPAAPALAMLVAILAVVAVAATVMTLVRPHHGSSATSQPPLATTKVAQGTPGGLLPEVTLRSVDGDTLASRSLRPAVLALLTSQCHCDDTIVTLAHLTSSTSSGRVPLYAVAPTGASADADALAGQLPAAAVFHDPGAVLATSVGADRLTLVLVRSDGTIATTLSDVTTADADQLRSQLTALLGRSATG